MNIGSNALNHLINLPALESSYLHNHVYEKCILCIWIINSRLNLVYLSYFVQYSYIHNQNNIVKKKLSISKKAFKNILSLLNLFTWQAKRK